MAGRLRTAGSTAAIALVASMTLGTPPALAGGGCHSGMTEGSGDTVAMSKACFGPSVLRVEPGTEVEFVNKDPIAHNVSANGWGEYDDLMQGERFTATFPASGVYPFACTYHPGMVGAIVVGDATGAGAGGSVAVSRTNAELAGSAAADGSSSSIGWVVAGAGGLVLGAGLGLVLRRRRGQPAE